MEPAPSLISVVGVDESIRQALLDLLEVLGFVVAAFDSAEAFVTSSAMRKSRCLILDDSLPGISGPQLQRDIQQLRPDMPIIFMTRLNDPALRGQVLGAGAVAYLSKPFGVQELSFALHEAFNATSGQHSRVRKSRRVRKRQ